MQALRKLAEKNQDRVTYKMHFIFNSDQVTGWTKTVTIDQDNWFDLQTIDVSHHQLYPPFF